MNRHRLPALVALVAGTSLLSAANIGAYAAQVDVSHSSLRGARIPAQMFAQSGSMGGTVGNREKSLSGSREAAPERAARQNKPKENRRPAAPQGNRGGGGSLDGSWSVSSAGVNCSDTFRETVVITGNRLSGAYGGGSVSANGSISGSGNYNGIGVTSRGRFAGRSGSGTFQRSDGCHGRWTATKQ